MKNIHKFYTRLFFVFFISVGLFACDYEEFQDADYPDSMLYMPTSYSGIYNVAEESDTVSVPTDGAPSRYYFDEANATLEIPLGVYRGGINLAGSFAVAITADTDTVNQMISSFEFEGTTILPESAFSIPGEVTIASGQESVKFNLSIKMDFINSHQSEKFAIGIGITSEEAEVNPELKTTIVFLDVAQIE